MKEYWVNVYESGYIGRRFNFKPHWNKDSLFGRIVYRIHVKMKETKPIGRQIPVKLQCVNKTYDWMDN